MMELEDLIKELQKIIDCNNEDNEKCFHYFLCEGCKFKHIEIYELIPDIKFYLERLRELKENDE